MLKRSVLTSGLFFEFADHECGPGRSTDTATIRIDDKNRIGRSRFFVKGINLFSSVSNQDSIYPGRESLYLNLFSVLTGVSICRSFCLKTEISRPPSNRKEINWIPSVFPLYKTYENRTL